nr:MAG TPA: hypothetical protein [Caudoviricetes sp.]
MLVTSRTSFKSSPYALAISVNAPFNLIVLNVTMSAQYNPSFVYRYLIT